MPPEQIRLPPAHHVDHVSARFQPRHPVPHLSARGPVPLHPSLLHHIDIAPATEAHTHAESSQCPPDFVTNTQNRNSFRRRKFQAAHIEPPGRTAGQLEEMLRIERTLAQSKTDKMLLEQFAIENALRTRITGSDFCKVPDSKAINRCFGPVVFDGNQNTFSMSTFKSTAPLSQDRSFATTADEIGFSSIFTYESENLPLADVHPDDTKEEAAKVSDDGTLQQGEDVSSPHPTILDNGVPEDALNTTGTLNISSVVKDVHQETLPLSFGSHEPCVTFADNCDNCKVDSALFEESMCSLSSGLTPQVTPFRSDPNGYYSNLLSAMRQTSLSHVLNSGKRNILLDAAESGQSMASVLMAIGLPPPSIPSDSKDVSKTGRQYIATRRSVSSDVTSRQSILIPAPRSLSNNIVRSKEEVTSAKQLAIESFIESKSNSFFGWSTKEQSKDPQTDQSRIALDFGDNSTDHKPSIKLIETPKEIIQRPTATTSSRPRSVIKSQAFLTNAELSCQNTGVLPTLIDRIPDSVILSALQNSCMIKADTLTSDTDTKSATPYQNASMNKKSSKEMQDTILASARRALKSAELKSSMAAISCKNGTLTRNQLDDSAVEFNNNYAIADTSNMLDIAAPLFISKYKDHFKKVNLAVIATANKDWNFGNERGGGRRAVHERYNGRDATFLVKKGQNNLTVATLAVKETNVSAEQMRHSAPNLHFNGTSISGTKKEMNELPLHKYNSLELESLKDDIQSNIESSAIATEQRRAELHQQTSHASTSQTSHLSSSKGNSVENFINARRSARLVEKKMVTQPLDFDTSTGEFLYSNLSDQIRTYSNQMVKFHNK